MIKLNNLKFISAANPFASKVETNSATESQKMVIHVLAFEAIGAKGIDAEKLLYCLRINVGNSRNKKKNR